MLKQFSKIEYSDFTNNFRISRSNLFKFRQFTLYSISPKEIENVDSSLKITWFL